jgi:hypothetical protein
MSTDGGSGVLTLTLRGVKKASGFAYAPPH